MKTLEKRLEEKLQTITDIAEAIENEDMDIEEATGLLTNEITDLKNKMKVISYLFAQEEIGELNSNDEIIAPKWYELYAAAQHKIISAEVRLEMFIEKEKV